MELPTTDELISQAQPQLPSTEELIQQNIPASERFHNITSAFGEGFSEATDNYKDLAAGPSSFLRSHFQDPINSAINEGIVIPAMQVLDAGMRTGAAAFSGLGAALQQSKHELPPVIGGPLSGIGEIVSSVPQGGIMGLHIPEAVKSFDKTDLSKAVEANVTHGEAVYMGTKEASPEQAIARETAAAASIPPPIHETARAIAPDTFSQYDRLTVQQEQLRNQLSEIAGTKGQEANISEVRDKLTDVNKQLHDLSPEVTKAYQDADKELNPQAYTPVETVKSEPIKPIEEQKQGIIDNEYNKITAAGGKPEVAQATAQLVAEHYQAISEQGWARGTAEEIYARDGANYRAGKSSVASKELAQFETPEQEAYAKKMGDLSNIEAKIANESNPNNLADLQRERDLTSKWLDEHVQELQQQAKGKIRLATEDAKHIITLMKSSDASTLIHETGHGWLDDMMRYARAEDAPESLKSAAAATRKWLGVDEKADFRATKPNGRLVLAKEHEKFARGFERYLMEGTAPSQALAGVFAKFKAWLTRIYKTVENLRSPINEDIRQVFDKLLSSSPVRTIITADHEPGKLMADIHETDAKLTPPEKAAGVADNIREEIKSTARQHDKEVFNAIKDAEKASASESDKPSVGGNAEEAGKRSDTERPLGKSKPVSPSGNGTANEGAGPNTRFPRADTRLVDKAGNIRLDNLNTPEDVNQVLRETSAENSDFMEARRGVISIGQQLDLADALGMDASMIDMRRVGQAYNAEQIIAARKLLVKSATSLREVMIKAADGTDQDIMAYAEAKARHRMIQEQVAGITAEAGRALGAFRKLEGSEEAQQIGEFLKKATGQDLFQLKEEAKFGALLETPQQVSKFINDIKSSKIKSMILEYYINSLISGPITHLRYSVGNALNALWTPLVETPVAAAIGKLKGTPDRVYIGEAGAQLHAILKGSQDGLRAAAQAFKTGVSPLLPGERMGTNFTDVKTNAIPGLIGKAVNIPGKSVSAIHSFFKSVRYEQNIQGLAYREAMKAGLSEGSAEFTNKIAQLTKSPTEAMMEKATANSLKELYMAPTEYNSTMGALNRAVNSSLLAKIIVPFMKIGSQITKNAFVERSVVGLASKEVRGVIAAGGAEADFQLAKIGTGMALVGATSLMAANGLVTGDGPENPKERSAWLLNHRPNSIQIGDITIPYQGLGSLGMLMRFSANMTETAHAWNGEDGSKLAVSFFQGLSKSVLDENFMRGVKDMLDAVYHPEEYGARYVKNFALNWLPYSVGLGQVARKVDPYQREARNIFDSARAKIPFVSEGLFPRRDIFGQEISNGSSDYSDDPVVKKMEELQTGIGRLENKILGVPLTDQQYDDYARMAGSITKMHLNAAIANPGFESLPKEHQIETISKIVSAARSGARNIIMMQNPEIMKEATDKKRAAAIR